MPKYEISISSKICPQHLRLPEPIELNTWLSPPPQWDWTSKGDTEIYDDEKSALDAFLQEFFHLNFYQYIHIAFSVREQGDLNSNNWKFFKVKIPDITFKIIRQNKGDKDFEKITSMFNKETTHDNT